MPGEGH